MADLTMQNMLININRVYGENTLFITKQYLYNNNKLLNMMERQRFLRQCKREDIVPNFILHKLTCFDSLSSQNHPYKNNIERAKTNFRMKFLNLEIKICNFTLKNLRSEVSNLLLSLKQLLDDHIFFKHFELILNKHTENIRDFRRKILNKKFNCLVKKQKRIEFLYDKSNVINLTNTILPEECCMIWSFGPKFSFPIEHNKVPIMDILADIENTLTLEEDINIANEKRAKTTNCITQFLKSKPKLSKTNRILQNALNVTNKFLKDNINLCITKSDKGNKTVIINKMDYQNKMSELLSDLDTYEIIPNDPTKTINKKCFKIIDELKTKNLISNQYKLFLKINNPIPPRIYGLPKIHKPNTPLRPIVSTINSPAYNLSKFCYNILKSLTQDSKYNLKNSFIFKDILKNIKIGDNEILASLDVVSLFTNVPLEIAKLAICERWQEIEQNCILTKEEFLRVLDVSIIDNNYFKYQGIFYKQKFGLAMGNPLSPILADIVLEKLFNEKLPLLQEQPNFIYKYVDDIILASTESNIDIIKSLFNSFHNKLKFTVEKESNNSLPFLDIKLHRRENLVKSEWYKKDIASDTLLNFISVHPYQMKKNVAHSFIKRVLYLSDSEFRQSNISKIINILTKNNYPIKLIKNLVTKTLYTYENQKLNYLEEIKYSSIAYVPNLTEKINKTLKTNSKILLANKIIYKASDTYTKLKDKIPLEQKDGVIYKIPCKDCDSCYVGETSKTKAQRIQQHKADVAHIKRQSNLTHNHYRSALVKHVDEKKHDFDFDNSTTVDHEIKKNKRLFKEACHIWLSKNPVNYKVDSNRLQANYINIIKNYVR